MFQCALPVSLLLHYNDSNHHCQYSKLVIHQYYIRLIPLIPFYRFLKHISTLLISISIRLHRNLISCWRLKPYVVLGIPIWAFNTVVSHCLWYPYAIATVQLGCRLSTINFVFTVNYLVKRDSVIAMSGCLYDDSIYESCRHNFEFVILSYTDGTVLITERGHDLQKLLNIF